MRSEFVLSGGVLGMCADCWGGGGVDIRRLRGNGEVGMRGALID